MKPKHFKSSPKPIFLPKEIVPLSQQRELPLQRGNLELSEHRVSGLLHVGSVWHCENSFEGSSHIYSTRLN